VDRLEQPRVTVDHHPGDQPNRETRPCTRWFIRRHRRGPEYGRAPVCDLAAVRTASNAGFAGSGLQAKTAR